MKTKNEETIEVNKNTKTESEENFESIKKRFWRGTFIPKDQRGTIAEYAKDSEYTRGFLRNN